MMSYRVLKLLIATESQAILIKHILFYYILLTILSTL